MLAVVFAAPLLYWSFHMTIPSNEAPDYHNRFHSFQRLSNGLPRRDRLQYPGMHPSSALPPEGRLRTVECSAGWRSEWGFHTQNDLRRRSSKKYQVSVTSVSAGCQGDFEDKANNVRLAILK